MVFSMYCSMRPFNCCTEPVFIIYYDGGKMFMLHLQKLKCTLNCSVCGEMNHCRIRKQWDQKAVVAASWDVELLLLRCVWNSLAYKNTADLEINREKYCVGMVKCSGYDCDFAKGNIAFLSQSHVYCIIFSILGGVIFKHRKHVNIIVCC